MGNLLQLDTWANIRAATRGDSSDFGAVAPDHDDLRIALCDNAALAYAPAEAEEFPLRLRRPAVDHARHPCVQTKLVGSGVQHLVGRRVERLRAERVRAFVQKLRAKLGDGAAKPAYISQSAGSATACPARARRDALGGVIVFDEAHAMANAAGSKGSRGDTAPSQQGRAGLRLLGHDHPGTTLKYTNFADAAAREAVDTVSSVLRRV